MSSAVCTYCHLPLPHSAANVAPEEPVYCCFGCSLAAGITRARGDEGRTSWMLVRLGLAVFLTMSVMVFNTFLYGQELGPTGSAEEAALSATFAGVMKYLSLLFATPVLLLLGGPVWRNTRAAWSQGRVSTDGLILLGVGAAFVTSYIATLTSRGPVYYETACVVLVLMTLGRYLEALGKLRASQHLSRWSELLPSEAHIRRGDDIVSVPLRDVGVGDRVVIPAGQRVGVDGVVEDGRSHLDMQWVRGESTPVEVEPGTAVPAGALNLEGTLVIRVTAPAAESSLQRLVARVEEARSSRGHYERLADRVMVWFIPATALLAVIGAVFGWQRAGWDEAVLTALAVLLIACPCALGLATPLAIWRGLGEAAARGIIIRDAETLEALARIRAVAFDKTGTLTHHDAAVESIFTDDNKSSSRRILAVAAGLAAGSQHHFSRAIVAQAERLGVAPEPVTNIRAAAGRGLTGSRRHSPDGDAAAIATSDGRNGVIMLGNVKLMRENNLSFSDRLLRHVESAVAAGQPLVCVAFDGRVQGVLTFREILREGAAEAVRELKRMGCRTELLTGDHVGRARILAERLDINVRSDLLPEDKLAALRELRARFGPVAMVGDGLNDAPALAAADVGIAMGCGSDLSRQSSAVCLLGDDVGQIPWLMALARRTIRTIRGNLFWAFAYNVIGIGLAVGGRLSPVFAAVAMMLSSLFVLFNSLRVGGGRRCESTGASRSAGANQKSAGHVDQRSTDGEERWGAHQPEKILSGGRTMA